MNLVEELLPGVLRVALKKTEDPRGSFIKTYSASVFRTLGIPLEMQEEFYSVSHRNVLRGMHFQAPPYDHNKVVYCAAGAVRDVLLDLRKGSGYGRVAETVLSADTPCMLFIPKGIAHGFVSLEDQSLMVYKTSSEYHPPADSGILWSSLAYDWKLTEAPVVSVRDQAFAPFQEFQTPF